MKEVWKDIKDYEGLYQVSNFGNVRSFKNLNGRGLVNTPHNLKPQYGRHNYYAVHLTKDKLYKNALIHRLVAETFIPNSDKLPQVNHIDGNKYNNHVNNLEWCTCKYNIRHAHDLGLHKKYFGKDNPNSKEKKYLDIL